MRDRILQLVQVKGPLLPVDVRSELRIDSMFVGAYLSELIKDGKIKASHAKIGSSPLYYVPGQERYLEQLRDYLHPKMKETFDLLKEKKVLRDSNLSEVMKAAVREIKDFAVPLTVNKKELFWKYHLVPQEEAVNIIKIILTPEEKPIPVEAHVTQHSALHEGKPRIADRDVRKGIPTIHRRAEEMRDKETIIVQKIVPEEKVHAKKRVEREQEHINKTTSIKTEEGRKTKKRKEQDGEEQTRLVNRTIKGGKDISKEEENILNEGERIRERIEQNIQEREQSQVQDPLLDKIKAYFNEKDIIIKSFEIVRKEKEINLIVSVPSVIGRISYFCVVRNKRKCNEGDVSAAVIKSQSKNMPTLFLTTGEVTKKALEMVGKEFKQLVINRLS